MYVFIGLSASINIDDKYYDLAKDIAIYLSDLKYNLNCGAVAIGIPKLIADIFKNKTSVKLYIYKKHKNEIDNIDVNYILYDDNFERLKQLYINSDLYIILPGGIGTLSELFGILEEIRGSNKKIILFNYNSYYDNLIKFLENKVTENFINKEDFNTIKIVENINEFKKEVENYER